MKQIAILIILIFTNFSIINAQAPHQKLKRMKVTVWDTYVTKKDGTVMHFDIIAPEEIKDATIIHGYGKKYLESKGQGGQPLSSKECRRCHVRDIQTQWEQDIKRQGYYILEMENCN